MLIYFCVCVSSQQKTQIPSSRGDHSPVPFWLCLRTTACWPLVLHLLQLFQKKTSMKVCSTFWHTIMHFILCTQSVLQLSCLCFRQKWFQMQSMAVMQLRPTRKPFQSGKSLLGSREKVLNQTWRVMVHSSCFNQVLMDSSCCNSKPEQKCCFSFFLMFFLFFLYVVLPQWCIYTSTGLCFYRPHNCCNVMHWIAVLDSHLCYSCSWS